MINGVVKPLIDHVPRNISSPDYCNLDDLITTFIPSVNYVGHIPSNSSTYDDSKLNVFATSFTPSSQYVNNNESKLEFSTYDDCKLNVFATSFIPSTQYVNENECEIELESVKIHTLKEVRKTFSKKIIVAHININSIRNKFEMLCEFINGNVDILLISETKIDESFPTYQFSISVFSSPFRYDRSCNAGGLLFYLRKDIPAKIIKTENKKSNVELFYVEINFFKKKWLIGCSYNPHKSMITNYLSVLSLGLDQLTQQYDNIILLGDFNCEPTDSEMLDFCEIYGLKNIVKEPTCFKNAENPSLIDLILTNKPKSFQNTVNVESGLSDFHKMTVTVMKCEYKKQPAKVIVYRDFKNYSNDKFRYDLEATLPLCYISKISHDEFTIKFTGILDKHAPLKKKYLRANNAPFVTRELRKGIMLRSKLANKYHKEKSMGAKLAYNKQRNICTYLVRKAKRDYYKKLKPSHIADTKSFWKTVKPLLSEKFKSGDSITLLEENVISHDDQQNAEIFNNFFINAVKNLNLEINSDIINTNVKEDDQILKAIKMFERHPSIIKIK